MYSCEICIWPDGTWCYDDELYEMTHMSDDYERVLVKANETVEEVVRRYT